MIGTELRKGMGLGNQLFCYITTRCAAERAGQEFSILGTEVLPGKDGEKPGLYFMELDYGKAAKKGDFTRIYHEKEDRIHVRSSWHDMHHGCYIAGPDRELLRQQDNTLLYGNMQDESYFGEYKEQIRQWLKVKKEYDNYEYSRENLCILNFRGGEYTRNPELFLTERYWRNAISHMKKIRSDMEFMVVTDDVKAALTMLPDIPARHFDVAGDYITVKNAKYLILSNSSFSFFPAFTSDTVQAVIAPKYWARHNVSDGYWASEQNIYTDFQYQDRSGRLFTAKECRAELSLYKEKSSRYRRLNKGPSLKEKIIFTAGLKKYYWGKRMKKIFRLTDHGPSEL